VNEYLTNALSEDHRRELLAEAQAESLAHEAQADRPSWWQRLSHRADDAPAESATPDPTGTGPEPA
jgi:hypothetical protein